MRDQPWMCSIAGVCDYPSVIEHGNLTTVLVSLRTIVTFWSSNMAMENPLQMELSMGKLSMNGGFSIATFDYRRVMHEELALASSTEPSIVYPTW